MKKIIEILRRIAGASPAPAEYFKAMPPPPPLRIVYDYQFCVEDEELEATIREINDRGYTLISVTQYGETYTVFFRRPA